MVDFCEDEVVKARQFSEEELVKVVVRSCGVPRQFASLDLASMHDGGDPVYRTTLDRVESIAEELSTKTVSRRKPVFLHLQGTFGSGKTRASTWLIRNAYLGMSRTQGGLARSENLPFFISAAQLVELRFGRNLQEDEEVEDERLARQRRLFSSRFLVIDDLGRLVGFRGEERYLERVIEERWNDCLSTVLTSSSKNEAFAERFQDYLKYFETLVFARESQRRSAIG